ncbi:hypothetical protein C9374_002657 [Naegleria lovaniensis]|uniref:Exocyst complex component n=1 Tax=Naegleria lovaniensis TaxID=51637 RepID=A0AA88GUT5_NAELO|nr:uncharacterized protein C9374_002657 [Naegleria lovaniensis]KAG2386211.1 hypothetical protein C9374_002657 [Naegleria lovaniensis]
MSRLDDDAHQKSKSALRVSETRNKDDDQGTETLSSTKKGEEELEENFDDWVFDDDEDDENTVDEKEILESVPETWRQASMVEEILERRQLHKDTQGGSIKKQQSSADQDFCEDPLDLVRALQLSKLKNGLNPYEEGFIPTKYIASFHSKFSFEVLKKSRMTCRQRKESQSRKLRQFVQDNLEKYVYLKDKLEEFFIGDREGRNIFNDTAVQGLEESFNSLQTTAKALFSPIIKTQQLSEEIRSMTVIVDKLKFLFVIPSDIKENRERKEYKKIILDYKKAKYFIRNSSSKILNSLYTHILRQVAEVRTDLFNKLKDPSISIDQKDRYIGYLYMLDAKEEDPVSFFIFHQFNYIVSQMQNLFAGVIENERQQNVTKKVKVSDQIKAPFFDVEQRDSENFLEGVESMLFEEGILWSLDSVIGKTQFNPAMNFTLYVESVKKLCNLLFENLQIFWRFSKYSLEDRYKQERIGNKKNSQVVKVQERERQVKKEAEILGLFNEIYNTFSILIRELFEKMDTNEISQPHIEEALKYFSTKLLSTSEFKIQAKFINPLYHFVQEMKNDITTQYCLRTISTIQQLHQLEDWILIKESNTTKLPVMLMRHVYSLIDILNAIMTNVEDCKDVKTLFIEALLSFADSVYVLAEEIDGNDILSSLQASSSHYTSITSIGHRTADKQLLLVVRNLFFLTKSDGGLDKMIHSFSEKVLTKDNSWEEQVDGDDLEDIDFDDIDLENIPQTSRKPKEEFRESDLVKNVFDVFEKLSNIVLNKWLRRKITSLSAILRKGVLNPGFKWSNVLNPTSVRSYIIETLLGLTLIHHEIIDMKAKSSFTNIIFREIKIGLLNTFNDCCLRLPEDICLNGCLQLDIEITFFDECLSCFDTEESISIFSKIRGKLMALHKMDLDGDSQLFKTKQDVIDKYKEKTAQQLAGFNGNVSSSRDNKESARRTTVNSLPTLKVSTTNTRDESNEDLGLSFGLKQKRILKEEKTSNTPKTANRSISINSTTTNTPDNLKRKSVRQSEPFVGSGDGSSPATSKVTGIMTPTAPKKTLAMASVTKRTPSSSNK